MSIATVLLASFDVELPNSKVEIVNTHTHTSYTHTHAHTHTHTHSRTHTHTTHTHTHTLTFEIDCPAAATAAARARGSHLQSSEKSPENYHCNCSIRAARVQRFLHIADNLVGVRGAGNQLLQDARARIL